MTATTVRVRRLVLDGMDPARGAEAVAAFQAELTRLLQRWPVGTDLAWARTWDPVRPRPGVAGAPHAPGSPAAVGEQAALAVHGRLLIEGAP